eukprot:s1010_g7.t1
MSQDCDGEKAKLTFRLEHVSGQHAVCANGDGNSDALQCKACRSPAASSTCPNAPQPLVLAAVAPDPARVDCLVATYEEHRRRKRTRRGGQNKRDAAAQRNRDLAAQWPVRVGELSTRVDSAAQVMKPMPAAVGLQGDKVAGTFKRVDIQGQETRLLRHALAVKLGVSRFHVKLFLGDESPCHDRTVLRPVPEEIGLLLQVPEVRVGSNSERLALFDAFYSGESDEVEDLFLQGLDPNTRDSEGNTFLQTSARWNKLRMLFLVLEAGADVDVVDGSGLARGALHVAVQHGHVECARALLEARANPNISDAIGCTPLFQAVRSDNFGDYRAVETVQALLGALADPGCRCVGSYPLLCAIEEHRYHLVYFLLEADADANSSTQQNDSALHLAARGNMVVAVEWLLAKQSDPWKTNIVGRTPLSTAIANRSFAASSVLEQAMFA